MTMGLEQAPDPQMQAMIELVKKYIAEGLPKNEAMKRAMVEVESAQEGEMAAQEGAEMLPPEGQMEPAMAPPMAPPAAPGAPAGMDPIAMMKQIALAKRGAAK